MANKQVYELPEKTTPVGTDTVVSQAEFGGTTTKIAISKLWDRANHTGEQAPNTITGLADILSEIEVGTVGDYDVAYLDGLVRGYSLHRVSTISALRLLSGTSFIPAVQVLGYSVIGDGGGGPVRVWKSGQPAGTYVDNGGSIIVPTGGDGSAAWLWEWTGGIKPEWFGADTSGVSNCATAITAAIASVPATRIPKIEFSSGCVYNITTKITLSKPVIFFGYGARITASVPNDYCFQLNDLDSTWTERYEFHGIEFKWGGSFGASTTGAIYIESANGVLIQRCTAWGLGKSFVRISRTIITDIRNCHVREHQNTEDIITTLSDSAVQVYCLRIKDNFLAFQAGTHTSSNITVRASFNLVVEDNAIEVGLNGINLSQYGAINSGRISNNFIEGCTTGLRLGTENGDGYYGFIRTTQIRNNLFTSCTTGILAICALESVTIEENRFDDEVVTGIDYQTTRTVNATLASQFFEQDITHKLVGFAYPTNISCVDATKTTIDVCDSLTGWSDFYNPATTGTTTLSRGFPGKTNSVQMSFSGTPTDQFAIQKTISSTDLSDIDVLVVPMYIDDPAKLKYTAVTDLGLVTRVLSLGPDSSNYWGWNLQSYSNGRTYILRKGWNILTFKKTDAAIVTGTPTDWSAITYLQLRLQPALTTDIPVVRWGGVFAFKLHGASDFAVIQEL
jgi:hypothetical protein